MKCEICGQEHTATNCNFDFDSEAKVMAMQFETLKSMGQRAYAIRQALHRAYRLGRANAVKFTPLDGGARTQPMPPMTFEIGEDNG